MKKYVTVLDFSTAIVSIYSYLDEAVEDLEEFITDKGHNLSDCQWMVVSDLILNIE